MVDQVTTVHAGPWGLIRILTRELPPQEPVPPDPSVRAFHRKLPGYLSTPLISAPAIADRLGVAQVWIKDETLRLGLPAFKVLGASWAAYRALERTAAPFAPWSELAGLRSQLPDVTLVAATDGNHGRAVARIARWFGLHAEIFVPRGTALSRIESIQGEGGQVTVVDGGYDDAVALADSLCAENRLVIADIGTSDSAEDVVQGYSTMLEEVGEQLPERSVPTMIAVQIGCGSFAASVLRYGPQAAIIGVEPASAACVLASLPIGAPVLLSEPQTSIMAGLNCGEPSAAAWTTLVERLDTVVSVHDAPVTLALRMLHDAGVNAGESGAAGLAGLLAVHDTIDKSHCADLGLTSNARILIVATEGVTDPDLTSRLLGGGRPPSSSSDQ